MKTKIGFVFLPLAVFVLAALISNNLGEEIYFLAFAVIFLTPLSTMLVTMFLDASPFWRWVINSTYLIVGGIHLILWGESGNLTSEVLAFDEPYSLSTLVLLSILYFSVFYYGFVDRSSVEDASATDSDLWASQKISEHGVGGFSFNFYLHESERLKRTAAWSLLGVGIVIVTAVFVVLFAGIITSFDLRSTELSPVPTNFTVELEGRLSSLQSNRRNILETKIELEAVIASGTNSRGIEVEMSMLKDKLIEVDENIARQKKRLEAAIDTLDEVRASELRNRVLENAKLSGAEAEATGTQALVASAVTRFGVIAVLLFFAQALMNLYRYSLRLAAHYQSHAISLLLSEGDANNLRGFAEVLSVRDLTFGKEALSPMGELGKAADIVSKLK